MQADLLIPRLAAKTEPAPRRVSAFDLLAAQPWAMRQDMLETMIAIARRENDGVEAVEARLGRPLQNTRTVSVRDGVAVIPVTGPVFRYANLFTQISGGVSLDVLARDFAAAEADPAVKSIVLVMDTPGGQASGIAEFAAMVRKSRKRCVAYVDDMAASAGYWVASAAHEVVISRTGSVGSIGAVISVDTGRRGDRLEIVSSQSPAKRPDVNTDQGRAQIQAYVDKLAQVFIEDVAAYRNVNADTVQLRFGQGDMRMGEEAVALGMADAVGTFEDLIARLAGNPSRKPNQGAKTMAQENAPAEPAITRESLAQSNPQLVATLLAEGAQCERARIQSVFAQSMPGHEAMIQELAFDGATDGPSAAVKVLAAERALAATRLDKLRADAHRPLDFAPAPDDSKAAGADVDPALPLEDRCKAEWDKSPSLRGEFGELGAYVAFRRASESGRVRILNQGNKE